MHLDSTQHAFNSSNYNITSNKAKKIAVLGAGSWGTALACLLSSNGHAVTLWSHSGTQIDKLSHSSKNHRYLPDFDLPESLCFSDDLQSICKNHLLFLVVVPSRAFRLTIKKLSDAGLKKDSLIMWGTKGFDSQNNILLSAVIPDVLSYLPPMAIVSGPSFANEVMLRQPTALTVGANTLDTAEFVANLFHNDFTRAYSNSDLIGVQVGGAVKNVMAIACGISDGLGYGSNSIAALITRGLSEITRLGVSLGALPETFQGLSGMGDLVLTCTDNKSRNRRFGLGIGRGQTFNDVFNEIGQEVEGYITSKEVYLLAQSYNIDMPICEHVYNVLYEGLAPDKAVNSLLKRNRTQE